MNQYNGKLMDKYRELPDDVREAIFSVDSAEIIQSIAKKNNLAVDQMSELADEIGLLMMGVTEPKGFISNISRRLKVDKKTAHDITVEVNEKIFSKIRESLKKIHNISDEKEEGSDKKEAEAPKPEIDKAPEAPKELSRENLLKEMEEPEAIPMKTTSQGNTKHSSLKSAVSPSSSTPTQDFKQEQVVVKENKELSIPPPPSATKDLDSTKGLVEPKSTNILKPQISRRPPEVSDHSSGEPLTPGGDRYPEGDPYREPVG